MIYTTLQLLHDRQACAEGYRKLVKHLGRGWKKDKPIPLSAILESNGLDDALWCLRATVEPCERFARELAADFAEHVLPIFAAKYPNDTRPRCTIAAARAFARDEINLQELAAAGDAARDAAGDAARDAAWDAARDAAGDAALHAAWAAEDAARAARAAAGAAARAAEQAWQIAHFLTALEGEKEENL